ncbi:hypothetical protein F5Y04DRAFT_289371 [Hypomontagnella monticulosa]|nr:hypothetical protein F5Y04DRAFT_289371 [Hypomontagnella monticulosa]
MAVSRPDEDYNDEDDYDGDNDEYIGCQNRMSILMMGHYIASLRSAGSPPYFSGLVLLEEPVYSSADLEAAAFQKGENGNVTFKVLLKSLQTSMTSQLLQALLRHNTTISTSSRRASLVEDVVATFDKEMADGDDFSEEDDLEMEGLFNGDTPELDA